MQDKTLSMFSEFTSTSFTATRASPGDKRDKSKRKLEAVTPQYKGKECFVPHINMTSKRLKLSLPYTEVDGSHYVEKHELMTSML